MCIPSIPSIFVIKTPHLLNKLPIMELPRPAQLELNAVTRGLLADLDALAHQVNEVRPLAPEILAQVKQELFAERVYSSNAIEGSTLTIRETRLVLEAGTVLDLKRGREAQEALSLAEAARQVEAWVWEGVAWHDLSRLISLHKTLLTGVSDQIAGQIRTRDVMIRGARHQPPSAARVPELVNRFLEMLSDAEPATHGLVLAAWAHWAIARIHPFEDGNGRLARLWQDLLLLHARYTVAIIRLQDRTGYLKALARADDGDFNPLFQLICQRVLSTLHIYRNAQEAADPLRIWAEELVGPASAETLDQRRLEYQRWQLAAQQILDAFERCASQLNRGGTSSLEIQIQGFDLIDEPTWETLRTAGNGRRIPFFQIALRQNQKLQLHEFALGRHAWLDEDDPFAQQGPCVAIFVVGKDGSGEADAGLSVQEIVGLGLQLGCILRDASTGHRQYETPITPVELAKRFFRERLADQ